MIYQFITENDLDIGLKKYFREQITEVTDKMYIQTTCEGAAFSLIKSKLNSRYDLTKLFPGIDNWNGTTSYLAGQYTCKNNLVYKAKQDAANKDPLSEPTYWEQSDPRDQLLVVYCAIITVYYMMRSINPRKITDDLKDEYEDILKWFDDVKNGIENPAWEEKTEGSNDVKWGSNIQQDHYF